MEKITIELSTPQELINLIIVKIKEKQKLEGYTLNDLSYKSGIGKKTIENFLYNSHITLVNLIILLKTLNLNDELNNLANPIMPSNDEEYKKLKHIRELKSNKHSNKKIKIDKSKILNLIQTKDEDKW